MSDQPPSAADTVAAAFVAHLQAFHAGLPAEEQALLEQVFQLAQQAAGPGEDTSGHGVPLSSESASLNYAKIEFPRAVLQSFAFVKVIDKASPIL